MTAPLAAETTTTLTPGARVVRRLNGRDWPGAITGVPFTAGDGARVRVCFDGGSSADVPVAELRPETAGVSA